MARKYRRSAQQFFSELLGRDPRSQRMKALYDIDRCYNRLSSILSRGVFDPSFDKKRYALSKALDDFYSGLKEAVTRNNWWDLEEMRRRQRQLAHAESGRQLALAFDIVPFWMGRKTTEELIEHILGKKPNLTRENILKKAEALGLDLTEPPTDEVTEMLRGMRAAQAAKTADLPPAGGIRTVRGEFEPRNIMNKLTK